MADINSFTFTGRLGNDAKVSTTPNGKTVMELSVANSTGYGDYKKTAWLKVRQWGDRVNNVAPIFKKGSLVGGTGEVSTEAWTGKDGTVHADIIVTCMSIQLLAGKKEEGNQEPASDSKESDDIPF